MSTLVRKTISVTTDLHPNPYRFLSLSAVTYRSRHLRHSQIETRHAQLHPHADTLDGHTQKVTDTHTHSHPHTHSHTDRHTHTLTYTNTDINQSSNKTPLQLNSEEVLIKHSHSSNHIEPLV